MAQALSYRRLCCTLAVILGLLVPVLSNYTSLVDALPELGALNARHSSRVGGQSFSKCCLLAVKESYKLKLGRVVLSGTGFIDLPFAKLKSAQFPCGAAYAGNDSGAPLVTVPYSWCNQNCPGWQQSKNRILSQWVQPFVGFILPAAAFCLSVPRKRKINIPPPLFRIEIPGVTDTLKALCNPWKFVKAAFKYLLAVFAGAAAGVIALLDTVIWVAVVFSTAGPMILSGLYEATLDRKVLEFIKNEKNGKVGDLQVHLLYAVLVGNLSFSGSKATLGESSPHKRFSENNTVWEDVDNFVTQGGKKERLDKMLKSQSSFGATVGAPVVFFLGSFLASVVSNLSAVGDNDTSHALAFGMWWMIIPHVAVISGCLLASNNPNILDAMVTEREVQSRPHWYSNLQSRLTASAYPSKYSPAWMWDRGKSKKIWIDRIQKSRGSDGLEIDLTLTIGDWIILTFITVVLVAVPFILAFLTSFYTPTVGLSCRSLTFLVYFCSQVWLCGVWIVDFAQEWFAHNKTSDSDAHNNTSGSDEPLSVAYVGWLPSPAKRESLNKPVLFGFYCLAMGIGLLAAIFTTIAGTFLQLLGVYRNCLCDTPLSFWGSRGSSDFPIVLSTNSHEAIELARKYWMPTGVTSIVLLIVVCYIGWWYQRFWRERFTKATERIPEEDASPQIRGAESPPNEKTGVTVGEKS